MKKVSNYETPEVTVFEIHSEGSLCQSLNGVTVNDFEYDGDELGC